MATVTTTTSTATKDTPDAPTTTTALLCRMPSLTAVPTTAVSPSQQQQQQAERNSIINKVVYGSLDKKEPHYDSDDGSDDDQVVGISADQTKFMEWMMPGLKLEMSLQRILAREQTPHQKVEVIESFFGKVRVQPYETNRWCFGMARRAIL